MMMDDAKNDNNKKVNKYLANDVLQYLLWWNTRLPIKNNDHKL